MIDQITQIRRYELKYIIDKQTAEGIRQYVQGFCSLDRHADPSRNGYVVNNMYFDTLDLRFYYDVLFRRLRRVKPRVRYYGDRPEDFIWTELKYKINSLVWKTRKPVALENWPSVLEPPMMLGKAEAKDRINTFEEVVTLNGAIPMLHVRYFREPWVSDINTYGRVTFDTGLTYRMAHGSDALVPEGDMLYYDDPVTADAIGSMVLLEIKVETLVPEWAIELIKLFNLTQRGFSKYCYVLNRERNDVPDVRQSSLHPAW